MRFSTEPHAWAIGSPTGSDGVIKVTLILCQDPSADSLGDIGKAQHHKPLQSGELAAGLATLVLPPVTWIYCTRGILARLSKTSARLQEDSPATGGTYKAAYSEKRGL